MIKQSLGDSGSTSGRTGLGLAALAVGIVLQLGVGFFTVAAVGLNGIAWWGAAILAGVWLAAAGLLLRTARTSPVMGVAIPVANGLVLWAVAAAGSAWWGWTP